MSTNQAFIKAYRRDPPPASPATPLPKRPVGARLSSVSQTVSADNVRTPSGRQNSVALWENSVELVTAEYAGPVTALVVASPGPALLRPAPLGPAIGKRPLSTFTAESELEPSLELRAFTPETTISAFRWPRICRALWEQYADQYERVAELLLARASREPGRGGLIGISGLHAGDGATTTTLCLAVALAARKTRAILVDANFRAPRLAGLLGVEPTTTWQDVLEHGLPVAEAVIRAAHDHVDLLPLDARAPNGREPNGAKLAAGLQTSITAGVLRYAYDVVLVDLGAVLAPRTYVTMSHLVRNMRIDAAVAVIDPRHAEPDDLTIAGELLDECGCELLGVIENRAAQPQAAYASEL